MSPTVKGPSEYLQVRYRFVRRWRNCCHTPRLYPCYGKICHNNWPLIERVSNHDVKQSWYADKAAAGDILSGPRKWWDDLVSTGPDYGYFPNANPSLGQRSLGWHKGTISKIQALKSARNQLAITVQPIGKTSFLNPSFEVKSIHGSVKSKPIKYCIGSISSCLCCLHSWSEEPMELLNENNAKLVQN